MTQKASMKRLLDNSTNNATGSGNSRFIQMLQSEGSNREERILFLNIKHHSKINDYKSCQGLFPTPNLLLH